MFKSANADPNCSKTTHFRQVSPHLCPCFLSKCSTLFPYVFPSFCCHTGMFPIFFASTFRFFQKKSRPPQIFHVFLFLKVPPVFSHLFCSSPGLSTAFPEVGCLVGRPGAAGDDGPRPARRARLGRRAERLRTGGEVAMGCGVLETKSSSIISIV